MMDQLLFQLANYEATSGLAFVPGDIDEAVSIQKAIAQKFNFFKRMIQNGECTIEELQQLVIMRNGPIPHENKNKSFDESLELVLKNSQVEKDSSKSSQYPNAIQDILHKIMEDIVEKNQSDSSDSSDVVIRGPFFIPATPNSQSIENPERSKDLKETKDAKNEKKKQRKNQKGKSNI